MTGYLGGAVASHVRVSNPLFSHTLFPIYIAAFVEAIVEIHSFVSCVVCIRSARRFRAKLVQRPKRHMRYRRSQFPNNVQLVESRGARGFDLGLRLKNPDLRVQEPITR